LSPSWHQIHKSSFIKIVDKSVLTISSCFASKACVHN